MQILGVRIDNNSRNNILEKIELFLSEGKFHQIATINAEFILEAQKNPEFKNILNSCNLNVADSISVRFAFLRFGEWLKCRIPGAELMNEIFKMANEKGLSVFLAASKNGLSSWEETRDALSKKYPNIKISGANLDPKNPRYIIHDTSYLLQAYPRDMILLSNFGAPEQEMFIKSVKSDTIKLAMGVGGSFDFITGKIKRAPAWMRNFGLEWLWRFIQEPRYRFKRIFNAVIVFPLKVLFSK